MPPSIARLFSPLQPLGDVFRDAAATWQSAGHAVAQAILLSYSGSSPCPAGSRMLIRDDGLFLGSVSAGCLEAAVIHAAADCLARGGSQRLDFLPGDDLIWGSVSQCGGRVSVFVHTVTAEQVAVPIEGRLIRLSDGAFLPARPDSLDNLSARHELGLLLSLGRSGLVSPDAFLQVESPLPRLAVVGGNEIAQHLAEMARPLGYGLTLIDPRAAFANAPRFPGTSLCNQWPDEFFDLHPPDGQTAVITLSHDIKIDDAALIAAARSDAFHIGALGSRRTHAARLKRLERQGLPPHLAARIEGPAGIDIGAIGPAEIALSMLGGVVKAWRTRCDAAER